MSFSTILKGRTNSILSRFNLKIETLTSYIRENKRILSLLESGYFEKPVFDVPKSFSNKVNGEILQEVSKYETRFDSFVRSNDNDVGYSFDNDYFSSPDVEVLYTIIREYEPRNIIEVGSGNSSLIIRQAIIDANLDTKFLSLDPEPRIDINKIADECIHSEVEFVDEKLIVNNLSPGDILFIDSSHEIKVGNDVVNLYLNIVPKLKSGVLIHIHDIFLPYEYPSEWLIERQWKWNEQYLVQALLMFNHVFEILWAGFYLQKTLSNISTHFPYMKGRIAKSLWLMKKG